MGPREATMSFRAIRYAALAATFLAGSAAIAHGQTSSTIGTSGSTAGGGSVGTVLGTGGGAAGAGGGAASAPGGGRVVARHRPWVLAARRLDEAGRAWRSAPEARQLVTVRVRGLPRRSASAARRQGGA